MIIREQSADPTKMRVTFALHEDIVPGGSISVVGDFNDWDPTAHPLQRQEGWRRASVELPAGTRHRFRYLADPDHWLNDETADDYEPNAHHGYDGVLDLRENGAAGPDPAQNAAAVATTAGAWAPELR